MCKWLEPPRRNHKEFRLRDVFHGKCKAISRDEVRITMLKSAFLFLCDNRIDDAIKVLSSHIKIDVNQAENMYLDTKGKRVDFDLFAHILIDYSIPLAYSVLYYNSLRIKAHLCPIILRKDQIERIIRILRNKDFHTAHDFYRICLDNSEKHLIKTRPYQLEEVGAIMKSIRDELKSYKVSEVRLFGSYARDEASQYSDMDIVVTTLETKIDNDYLFGLQSILEDTLKIPLDLHIFQNKIDYSCFDKKMCSDMVKVL